MIAALVGSASAQYGSSSSSSGYSDPYDNSPAYYKFGYDVKDDYGQYFGQQENRDGHDTKGKWYVLLPDGKLQTVKYNVNGYSGFQAQVNYEQLGYGDSKSYGGTSDYAGAQGADIYRSYGSSGSIGSSIGSSSSGYSGAPIYQGSSSSY